MVWAAYPRRARARHMNAGEFILLIFFGGVAVAIAGGIGAFALEGAMADPWLVIGLALVAWCINVALVVRGDRK